MTSTIRVRKLIVWRSWEFRNAFIAAIFVALQCIPAHARFSSAIYTHTQAIKNTTGRTANDLHVNVIHAVVGTPTAPPFTTATVRHPFDDQIDFSGATVASGGTVTFTWQSVIASDRINLADPGYWTFNGTNIGNIPAKYLQYSYIDLGGGAILVSVTNSSASAIAYSNLQIFRDADSQFFTQSAYLAGLTSGVPVSLMIPTSGTFLPGATSVAQFSPSSSPYYYSGGSVIIEDLLLGHAGSTRYFGAPLFSSISVLPSGAVQLLLSTELGSACEIQASPNLLAWSHVTTMTNFTGSLQYTDNPSPISNARFYRAVQLPQ